MRGAKVENIFLLRHRISKESRFSLVSMGKTEMEVTTIDLLWCKNVTVTNRGVQLTSFGAKNVTVTNRGVQLTF